MSKKHDHKNKHHRDKRIVEGDIVMIRGALHYNGWFGILSGFTDKEKRLGVYIWWDTKRSKLPKPIYDGFKRHMLKRVRKP